MLSSHKRLFGLDIARSIAIIFVLIGHGLDLFFLPVFEGTTIGDTVQRGLSYPIGFFGVEIFFVLSGFLIGGIIIKEIVENGSLGNLINFYIRRWFRTLPLYYLVVIFLIFFPTGEKFTWTNLFFMQNFNFDHLSFNPVSWSLSVEEWFYLLIPLGMLISFHFIKKNKAKNLLLICFTVIVLSLLLRIVAVFLLNPSFDFGIRKQFIFRLDSITAGVVLAGIKYYYKNLYNKIVEKKKTIFIIAITGLLLCEFWLVANNGGNISSSFFSRTFFYNVISFFCALFVISVETVKYPRVSFIGKVVTFFSLISYGLYLIHIHIYLMIAKVLQLENVYMGMVAFVVSLTLTVTISFLLYKYYEVPMMNLRDKVNFNKSKNNNLQKVV